jgi:antitoxin PrlF
MSTSVTTKGQVTIPKSIRDALGLKPGSEVDFKVNEQGQVILVEAKASGAKSTKAKPVNRFEALRGKAQIKWRTDELMALLRG